MLEIKNEVLERLQVALNRLENRIFRFLEADAEQRSKQLDNLQRKIISEKDVIRIVEASVAELMKEVRKIRFHESQAVERQLLGGTYGESEVDMLRFNNAT